MAAEPGLRESELFIEAREEQVYGGVRQTDVVPSFTMCIYQTWLSSRGASKRERIRWSHVRDGNTRRSELWTSVSSSDLFREWWLDKCGLMVYRYERTKMLGVTHHPPSSYNYRYQSRRR